MEKHVPALSRLVRDNTLIQTLSCEVQCHGTKGSGASVRPVPARSVGLAMAAMSTCVLGVPRTACVNWIHFRPQVGAIRKAISRFKEGKIARQTAWHEATGRSGSIAYIEGHCNLDLQSLTACGFEDATEQVRIHMTEAQGLFATH